VIGVRGEEIAMRRATAALALAVVGAYAGFASAAPIDHPMPSDWSFTLGAGALLTPSYPGAASTKVVPLPFVDVRYKDRIFLSPIAGLGVNVLAVPGARLGVSLLPDLGRSASQGNRLRGWGDISAGADVKLFGELRVLGPLAVLASVRRQLGGGNGTVVDAGLTGTLPLMRRLIVSATATVSWANGRYTQSYFGVGADQSAAALLQGSLVPTFAAGAGLRDASLGVLAIVPIDRHWSVNSIVRTEVLLGDAATSPLTERRFQLTFGGFLAYRF
jgi:outer membrane scaffolding protein for murein synthesis (MipA/OmpV family)